MTRGHDAPEDPPKNDPLGFLERVYDATHKEYGPAVERRRAQDRLDAAKFFLWVWLRARCRERIARRRIRAVWIADGLMNPGNSATKKEVRAAQLKATRFFEIGQEIATRRGVPPSWDEQWDVYEERYGPTDRVIESPPYRLRLRRRAVDETSDEKIEVADRFMSEALQLMVLAADRQTAVLAWFRAKNAIKRHKAEATLGTRHVTRGVDLCHAAYHLLLDFAAHQRAVVAGQERPMWFCLGCDEWHQQEGGAPARFLPALLQFTVRASAQGGLRRGDATRLHREIDASGAYEMPGISRWYKFAREHYLYAESDVRTLLFRDAAGKWRLCKDVRRRDHQGGLSRSE